MTLTHNNNYHLQQTLSKAQHIITLTHYPPSPQIFCYKQMTYTFIISHPDNIIKEQDLVYEKQILSNGNKIRSKEEEIITEKISTLLTIRV